MKLQKFYILAAAALLIGAVSASAQTAAFNATAGPFDNLDHDCVVKSELGNQVLLLGKDDVVKQSFAACVSGITETIYLKVQQVRGNGHIKVSIEDTRGNEIGYKKVSISEGFSGIKYIKMQERLEENNVYFLVLRSVSVDLVIDANHDENSSNHLYLNGWKLDGNIATAIGTKEVLRDSDSIQAAAEDAGTEERTSEFNANFSVYPNPFSNDFSVKFNRDLKGETTVMLTDLSGNVLHREVRMNPLNGQQVYINPVYNLHPGAYALRIINDNRLYTQTLMKQ